MDLEKHVDAKPTVSQKIKRPMNSFMLYRKDKQHEIAQKNPGINYREVNKMVGEAWRMEEPYIKEIYSRLALDGQVAHKVKYPDYKYPSSIAKKKKKMISTGTDLATNSVDSSGNGTWRVFPYSKYGGAQEKIQKKDHPSLIPLITKNLEQTAAIPNSPRDRFAGSMPFTKTLLSPIAFSFDRDPILNAFLNSWEYSEFAQRSGFAKSAERNKKFIPSSLGAHLPGHLYSANL